MSKLEDLDFRNYISLLSSKRVHIQDKTSSLTKEAWGAGLKCKKQKCKVMRNNNRNNDPVPLNEGKREDVDKFVYFGATTSQEVEEQITLIQ